MYKILLWDVDGTLLDFLAAEKYAIKACFEQFKLGKCTDEMIDEYSAINKKYWERLECGEITKREVLTGRFKEFFELKGIDTSSVDSFNKEYQVRLSDTIVFCDNSKEIVSSLTGRIKQYVVSNGTIIAQSRKMVKSGFDKLMNGVFLSEQLGYEKPSKKFFDKVFEQIEDVPKNEILIVGDSLTSDIKGGNNAGIKTCWYNSKMLPNNMGIHTDYEIHNLHDVFAII